MRFMGSPPDQQLSPFAQQVFDVLAKYSALPWPIMAAQCRRVGVEPASLVPADMSGLAAHLSHGVARFTSPEKGVQVLADLNELAHSFQYGPRLRGRQLRLRGLESHR